MKLLAVDVETGGLDPKTHSLLEAAFIAYDGIKRRTLRVLFPQESYTVEPIAASMHAKNGLWDELDKYRDYRYINAALDGANENITENTTLFICGTGRLSDALFIWLGNQPKDYTVIGKNAGTFDIPFLIPKLHWEFFSRRVIDVGTLYLRPDDNKVPNFQECLKRASLAEQTSHRALDDCQSALDLYDYWRINQWKSVL